MIHRERRRGRFAWALVGLALMAGLGARPGAAMAEPAPIPDGRYHCKAGGSSTMLTLCDIEISGTTCTFTTPTGEQTSGNDAVTPSGYQWQGDLGALTDDQIVESGADATPGHFHLRHKVRLTSLATTLSCGSV